MLMMPAQMMVAVYTDEAIVPFFSAISSFREELEVDM